VGEGDDLAPMLGQHRLALAQLERQLGAHPLVDLREEPARKGHATVEQRQLTPRGDGADPPEPLPQHRRVAGKPQRQVLQRLRPRIGEDDLPDHGHVVLLGRPGDAPSDLGANLRPQDKFLGHDLRPRSPLGRLRGAEVCGDPRLRLDIAHERHLIMRRASLRFCKFT
jgi:hypothetical protein